MAESEAVPEAVEVLDGTAEEPLEPEVAVVEPQADGLS